jgi:hypothetical protein
VQNQEWAGKFLGRTVGGEERQNPPIEFAAMFEAISANLR